MSMFGILRHKTRRSIGATSAPKRDDRRSYGRTAVPLICCLLIGTLSLLSEVPPALALGSTASVSENEDDNAATVTEAKGTVLKAEAADGNFDPKVPVQAIPAKKGDRLHDGMQVATGDKSYAQLAWTDVTARAWANSLYSISPSHRLVYLQRGQMIFNLDKHRKDKREYFLWTNLLQARVRGTTVFLQSDGVKTQISVLEGTIDVLNKRDKSVVRLTPGVVYQVLDTKPVGKTKDQNNDGDTSPPSPSNLTTTSLLEPSDSQGTSSSNQSAPLAAPVSISQALSTSSATEMLPVTIGPAVPLFATENTVVSVFAANVANLLKLPLLNDLESALPSIALVQKALNSLPLIGDLVPGSNATLPPLALNSMTKNVQILKVPTGLNYAIGSLVGQTIKLPPDAMTFFPPNAIIQPQSTQSTDGKKLVGGVMTAGGDSTIVPLDSQMDMSSIITTVTQANAATGQAAQNGAANAARNAAILSGLGASLGSVTGAGSIVGFTTGGAPITMIPGTNLVTATLKTATGSIVTVQGTLGTVAGTVGGAVTSVGTTAGSLLNTTGSLLNNVTSPLLGGGGFHLP